ncbi:hypothetical protein BKM16_22875 [Pseudomonas amygdali pv. morsprunorum]|nr:hypothetical protein AL056_12045 [Pseudomonas amygdali pv. morsprunorum]KWS69713.1 hypothetical protein AL054_18410 [Pseudomonas amygdali pv. morsprunorum]PHX26091.1 hypothetical protein AO282_18330 [Pseudomonas amygdali pv. morsprunorum]POC92248.1 hypothetical protein BKM08_02800 [Pseudomonas amygdali pv. morsprunorum]POC99258.1 hypothetical protein BKM22_23200 [Pseudomonas amygdali pv. morsprunorum]
MYLHGRLVVSDAQIGTSRAVAAGGHAAIAACHDVADVLVPGMPPFRRGFRGMRVGARWCCLAATALDQREQWSIRCAFRQVWS